MKAVLKGDRDPRSWCLVSNKRALFAGLFDGTTDSVRFETPAGFLADVQRLIEPVSVPEIPASVEDDAGESALPEDPDEPMESAPTLRTSITVASEPPATREETEGATSVEQAAPARTAPASRVAPLYWTALRSKIR